VVVESKSKVIGAIQNTVRHETRRTFRNNKERKYVKEKIIELEIHKIKKYE
jgi:hypothetical protein